MSHLHKVIFISTLIFFVVDAKPKKHKDTQFPNLRPFVFTSKLSGDDDINFPIFEGRGEEKISKGDFEIGSIGHWEIISQNAGVSAMHVNLMPSNKIIIYDAQIYRTSRIKLPDGVPCLPYKDANTQEDKLDCFAHSVEYDIETNQVRPLKVNLCQLFFYLSLYLYTL